MSPQSTPDLSTTNRIFEEEVIARKDFGALSRVYTRNARVLPPGAEMAMGLEAAQAFWQQAVAGLGVQEIRLRSVSVEVLGSTAIEIGRATIVAKMGAMEVKYVVVWKQEDGAWKWDVDIWNAVA